VSDSSGRVAVVTGATGGMGGVIALELASRGMHVVTVARDPGRAQALSERIAAETDGTLQIIQGDLSHRTGVMTAADAIRARHDTVHLLINNAGAHYPDHRLSLDGIEMHIAVNYLAGYGLTVLLEEELRRGSARVVTVASDSLRDTRQVKIRRRPRPATIDTAHLDDLAALNPAEGFAPFEAYARAKLLAVTAGYDLARTLGPAMTINAVHPGIVATDIVDDLMPRLLRPLAGLIRRAMLTPEQGAAAAVRLATDPLLRDVTGRYFDRDSPVRTPAVSYDLDVQARLRVASQRFIHGDGS
jgi:NAD(P)-dependent dehydrogenase (short-subunit alcohol dehydrogenase family)